MYPIANCSSDSTFTRLLLLSLLLWGLPATSPAQTVTQSPLPAEQTLEHFVLHPDCRIELVAAEPDVIDPVAIAFAPDGRLWVVEYSDYPNGPPENGPPLSRIRTLTDADGDGRYTDAVTFADKLLFANGLMLWQDGVIVTSDGAVTFMRDLDGDGKADEQTEWFKGFAKDNPQLRANHPTLGLDGHIYVASGLRGGEVIAAREDWAKDAKSVSLSGRDFRFDPFTGKHEAVSGPCQFGVCFDPFGNRFTCSNRNPNNHVVLEDRYLARNPYLAVSKVFHEVSPAAENSKLFPISRTWTTSNLHANQFTAACGVLIYGGDALPQFRGNSFTCEPTANLVHRDVLEPKGATFTSHYGREGVEFLATRDEWFRPVNLTHGPDGALYVVDMYRAVIEHPQFMPDELKTRPDLTLGNDRGRIYRIVSRDESDPRPNSERLIADDAVAEQLKSPNAWHRETAFRLLAERRQATGVAELLDEPLSAESLFAVLSLLDVVDAMPDNALEVAFAHDDHRVLIPFIQIVERKAAELGNDFSQQSGYDKVMAGMMSAMVGKHATDQLAFQAALSLGAFPANQDRAQALAAVLTRHAEDPWFHPAIASAAAGQEAEVFLTLLGRGTSMSKSASEDWPTLDSVPQDLTQMFCTIVGSRGDTTGAAQILRTLVSPPDGDAATSIDWQPLQFTALVSLGDGLRRGSSSLPAVLDSLDHDEQAAVRSIFAAAREVIAAADQPTANRVEAMPVAVIDPAAKATAVLSSLVRDETDQAVLTEAIAALSRKSDPQVADVLLEGFKSRTPSVRSAILSALLARGDRTHRLLDEIESGNLTPRDIDAASATRLTKSRDAKIKQRAAKLLASTTDVDRAKVITMYQPCLSSSGDPQRGLELFKKTCATCHKVGEIGTNVGPDISDSRTKTPEFLLTNILDPNRAVDGNFFGYTILDVEGRVHTGIITSETASSVTLRLPEGKEVTLLRSDIEEMVNTGLSLMPVGLEKDISVEQMADLISFIKNWRYLDGSVPQEVIR